MCFVAHPGNAGKARGREQKGGGAARPRRARRQRGYMLLAILLMLALLLIAAVAVAPSIATQIKRDREEELVRRGSQYARAVKRYYRKFGRFPGRIEDLENTNNVRFLRKRYKDPITGKDDWRIIHFGEATVTPNMFGANPAAPGGSAASAPGSGGLGVQAPASSGLGTPVSQLAGSSGSRSGGSGGSRTFGGGPMVGVASISEAASLKELNGKDHYNQWEFVYDPRYDLQAQQALGAQGVAGAGTRGPQGAPGGQPAPGLPGMGAPGPPQPPPPRNPQ